MAVILARELALFGCSMGSDDFRVLVRELHVAMHPAWTDEELLYHPYDALRFCAAVRGRSVEGLPDALILRTLLNVRKQARK